ncbi:MAG: STAS domain-containing protein [Cellvibrionaceae bacterium]|nr:STAS domain-containing protein [Cellvibrionaceae bacterium]
MKLHVETKDNATTVYLNDRFDFSYIDDFQSVYADSRAAGYTIDFRETDYMDSSGLGMLLNMKRALGDVPIDLINCKPQIKKILVISRFDNQFSIQ